MASSEGADDGWELTEDDLIALGILSSDAQQQPVAEEFPPNIYELFRHYNATYFQNSLEFCSVQWSTGRMTLCAGICTFSRGSGCVIKLSEPLLKYRPLKDLKETLLHEMIHAYQFLVDKGPKDRDDHGPRFKQIMHSINQSTVPDPQRPPGGYNIDTHHTMIDEVNLYRVHWWECQRCHNIIKRAMNRKPQPADCRGRMGRGDACQDPKCLYHMHIKTCGGEYVKIKGPDLDKAKADKEGGAEASKAAGGKRSTAAAGSTAAGGKKKKGAAGSGSGAGGSSGAGPSSSSTPAITQFFKKADTGACPSSASVPVSVKQEPVEEPGAAPAPEPSSSNAEPLRPEEQRARCLEAALARLGGPGPPQQQRQEEQTSRHIEHAGAGEAPERPMHVSQPRAAVHAAGPPNRAPVVVDLTDSQPTMHAGSDNKSHAGTGHAGHGAAVKSGHHHQQQQQQQRHAGLQAHQGVGAGVTDVIVLDESDDESEGLQGPGGSSRGGSRPAVQQGPGSAQPAASVQCPVCGMTWRAGSISNQDVNRHLDECLQSM